MAVGDVRDTISFASALDFSHDLRSLVHSLDGLIRPGPLILCSREGRVLLKPAHLILGSAYRIKNYLRGTIEGSVSMRLIKDEDKTYAFEDRGQGLNNLLSRESHVMCRRRRSKASIVMQEAVALCGVQ